jgi:hypothetical protein
MTQEVDLHARRVYFFSQEDEAAFFGWIKRMPCIARYAGIGGTIHIHVDPGHVDDDALRELIALFRRYEIEMKQLLVFVNESNRAWVTRPGSYWFGRMFE